MSRMSAHNDNLSPGVKQSDIDYPVAEPDFVTCDIPMGGHEVNAGTMKECVLCGKEGCRECLGKCRGCLEYFCKPLDEDNYCPCCSRERAWERAWENSKDAK